MSKKSGAANHIHRYRRINLSTKPRESYEVLRCTKPACTHYIRVDMAEGQVAECNRCGNPFVLNRETVRLAKPHCTDCIKRKKSETVDAIAGFLEGRES